MWQTYYGHDPITVRFLSAFYYVNEVFCDVGVVNGFVVEIFTAFAYGEDAHVGGGVAG